MEMRLRPESARRLRIKNPDLKGEILDKLINGAHGMFRWIAVQLDYFCDLPSDFDLQEALKSLPPDFFSSYARLLVRINKMTTTTQDVVARVLKWITHNIIPVEALLEALSVKPGIRRLDPTKRLDVDEILMFCGNLVRLTSDGRYIELAHLRSKNF
ncbi:uncharacterized protein Z519_06558 [Cladophialophora bantiana CBS 173.52]|uniref:Uncharacterized protein n=1 Tax=Cladophialophora bantiana (strain ATCC 10958 / CBS 173.52 / CDC B-1940 / NIH 8579) TaxID=1442370 RepID=A0A0D2HPD9_CLAB1|nr:uncharacterized protein Z519_06558 [Cladophialophora bantiana CBS 173.52]KIW92710.1 hypothetical protein Z519_06558 [Cladophialophora bantiana CBS 173.52]